ncbi:hypothetical protein [Chryseobacterium sp. CH25]|uniref:hypothetical protein n=1 Tax=Chryseobacterium sp. CH25 TaxID=713559 RepID=UPI00100A60EE|nr:hypothetical protein [Chryseobacterium sp. CH25]RXM53537.1 hypothetical protein BOQ64_04070 [Chryseobacterium sp. CH25]
MRSIEEKIKGIQVVSKKFSELRTELISNQEIIVNLLKEIINKYASDYSLVRTNSVRTLRFYTFVYRVKEKDSFSEKLIRNNDYNHFYESLNDLNQIDEPNLKNKVKELDDLIGIKILTDLNVDSVNMYKLIGSTNFIQDARNKGITMDEEDLQSQPITMKNGLKIFKLKCKYETWNFELQIKSKLESAWGDMEHAIFYKNYKLTPVRSLAQQSMNHVGKLLIEIDDFLQDIREANDNFTINSDVILFINKFEETFADKVGNALDGINFNFKKIASLTYNIHNIDHDIFKTNDIKFDHLSFPCQKYSKYIQSRNKDFDLQVFESIILSSFETIITNDNLETYLDTLFELIQKSYNNLIISNNVIQDEELAEKLTKLFFNTCIEYGCQEFILNTINVTNHFNDIKLIYEAIEVLELDTNSISEILKLYTIYCFKGDMESFTSSINKDTVLGNIEKAKIELSKIDSIDNSDVLNNLNSIINILG